MNKVLSFPGLVLVALILSLGLAACSPGEPALKGPLEADPGTIEDLANPLMKNVEAAQKAVAAGPDDVVIYYWRDDGKYDEWGFWIWAFPGGDGAISWDNSQKLSVAEGVGYLKFKRDGSDIGTPLVGSQGTGIIARRVDGWTKDGADDRIFNTTVTNEWVIFSNDQKTYPFGAYRPSIEAARLSALDTIQLTLSGRHAVEPRQGADNGFVVTSSDGSVSYKIRDIFNPNSADDRSKNYSRRLTMVLDGEVDLTKGVMVSHPSYQLPVLASATDLSIELAENTVPPADYQLGAVYDPASKSVEFRLWTPLASSVRARIFASSEAESALATLDLVLDKGTGVWSGRWADRDPDGMFYEYEVEVGGLVQTVLDPYARSMGVFRGSGPGRGAIVDSAKALPPGGWEGLEDVDLPRREDAIIYEVSIRDFTISPDAKVKGRPGSYLAFIEKLPYIKSLGVTHIQLLPVLNFYYTDETVTAYEATGTSSGNNYNWGYDPHSYFTPEGWFASDPADPYARMTELKTLIKEAHRLGLGVLFDVVYNHTAKTSMLNDIVPGYYYRLTPEGAFKNNSGVGNDTASERVMMRRLISDSIHYLVDEYKIDGFRFDLMGLMDAETVLSARARAATIPGKADVLFQGEGWKMYNGPTQSMMDQNFMAETEEVSVFNDEFRDILKGGGLDDSKKGFITDNHINPKLLVANFLGNPQLNYSARHPANNMNYTEAHDNLTMRDNIVNNIGLDDRIPAQRAELIARLRMGNFFVLTSQGIAFLHAGQEQGRSKPKLNSTSEVKGNYVHNSYDAADNINQFIWNPHPDYQALRTWTQGLMEIRKTYQAFRLGDARLIEETARQIEGDGILSVGWAIKTEEGEFIMLGNGHKTEKRSFDLGSEVGTYQVLVDRTRASTTPLANPRGLSVNGSMVTLDPLTVVMIKR